MKKLVAELRKNKEKVDLLVCFSGGRTSAFMARNLQLFYSDVFNLTYVFINTSAEDPRTLEFVNECDVRWGLGIKWIESKVHKGVRKSSTYTLTDFKSAKRNYELFYDMCEKYGVPNASYPHCTRELKIRPLKSFMKDTNLSGALRAIGIRSDEIDRMSASFEKDNIVYPLISLTPTTKIDVLNCWAKQDFNLEIPEHRGNCVTCWKKSDRKIKTLALETPSDFDHFAKIEQLYGSLKVGDNYKNRVFFRKQRSANEMVNSAKEDFEIFKDEYFKHAPNIGHECDGGCGAF